MKRFFSFCAAPPPYGDVFEAWRARTEEEMQRGKHISGMGSYER